MLILRVFFQFLLAVILFLGGIWVLSLRIPGWSLILGLPSVQVGLIFMIFTFDKLAHDALDNYLNNQQEVDCSVCGKKTATPIFIDGALCPPCRRKKRKKSEKEA